MVVRLGRSCPSHPWMLTMSSPELDAHAADLEADVETCQSPVSKAAFSGAHAQVGGSTRDCARKVGSRRRKSNDGSRIKGGDEIIIQTCEELRRLHTSCQDVLAQLLAAEANKLMAGDTSALDDCLWHMRVEYEGRVLRLQERPVNGGAGLLAMGEHLEAFLEFKGACLDADLLLAIKAYLANVRGVVAASKTTTDTRSQCSTCGHRGGEN